MVHHNRAKPWCVHYPLIILWNWKHLTNVLFFNSLEFDVVGFYLVERRTNEKYRTSSWDVRMDRRWRSTFSKWFLQAIGPWKLGSSCNPTLDKMWKLKMDHIDWSSDAPLKLLTFCTRCLFGIWKPETWWFFLKQTEKLLLKILWTSAQKLLIFKFCNFFWQHFLFQLSSGFHYTF